MLDNGRWIDTLFFRCSFLLQHPIHSLLLGSPTWRLYAKAHTSLPVNILLLQRKPRSGEGCHTLELKISGQAENAFQLFQGKFMPFTQAEALQQMSQQTNPWARPWTCELPSTQRVCSSFPHTSEEPQPLANTRKISARLTESQPYPNKPENFHF